MNFLAHIYLSYNNPQIEFGNFIADSVRKSQLPKFDAEIQKGVLLHWEIDDFTDSHPVVKKSKELLYPKYGKYSAVLVDIYYDHFLALHWPKYHNTELLTFSEGFYSRLTDVVDDMPNRIQHMLPYLKEHNWLYNYQFFEGMEKVMHGMSRRATFESKMEKGVEDLKLYYPAFEEHFFEFFPDLENMAKDYLQVTK